MIKPFYSISVYLKDKAENIRNVYYIIRIRRKYILEKLNILHLFLCVNYPYNMYHYGKFIIYKILRICKLYSYTPKK